MEKNNTLEQYHFAILKKNCENQNPIFYFIVNPIESPLLQGFDCLLSFSLSGSDYTDVDFSECFIPNTSFSIMMKNLSYEKWCKNINSITGEWLGDEVSQSILRKVKKHFKNLEKK